MSGSIHRNLRAWLGIGAVAMLPAAGSGQQAGSVEYAPSTVGTRWLTSPSGLTIKLLVESTNLGGAEVEIGEITFPAGQEGPVGDGHLHGAVEIFYILSGELDHIVNGVSHLLEPGMVGIVRPGDRVVHRVASAEPVKALVIWAPGGEAGRLAPLFDQRPVGRE